MNKTEHDFRNKLYFFLSFNSLVLFVIFTNILILGGLFYHPFEVGVYVVLPYLTITLIYNRAELKDGSRWRYFSENFFIFRLARQHLGMDFELHKALQEAEKDVGAQFIFALFPHGTAADYRILMDGIMRKYFPNINEKIRCLSASVLFRIPVVRELGLWTGCVDASRVVAERLLNKDYSILVLPGGEAEQIRTVYKKETIFLKSRKGFVKLAMRNSVPIVPVYVFGASDYYHTNNALFGPRLWLQKKLGICIPLATGMWGSILCPHPVWTTIVFGEPLSFKLKESGKPTDEELETGHEEFCNSLIQLFDTHKLGLGYGDRSLEIY